MSHSTRLKLLIFFIVIFLIIVPVIIFYSQGYRFDFQNKKVVQTGAFYFKILPVSSKIFLDGKFKAKTDSFFFSGSSLIENLLPKIYKIEVKKEEYFDWQKNLPIKEKEVTEIKNLILFPEKLNQKILGKNVSNFFPSPDSKKIILKKTGENGWFLTLLDTQKNIESDILEEKGLSKKEVEFLNLIWDGASKRIILNVVISEEKKYFIFDLENNKLYSFDFPPDIEKIIFSSQKPESLLFLQNGKIFQADYKKKTKESFSIDEAITFEIVNNVIYYLNEEGFIFKSNLKGNSKEKINLNKLPIKEETYYQIIIFGSDIFLKEDDILYYFNQESKNFEKISDIAKRVELSPDEKKIAYFSDYEIWLFFLKPEMEEPKKEAKEKVFLTRFSEKIDDIFWLNPYYLMVKVGNSVKIIETDDRDRINAYDFPQLSNKKIFWNQSDKKLYFLNNDVLATTEILPK